MHHFKLAAMAAYVAVAQAAGLPPIGPAVVQNLPQSQIPQGPGPIIASQAFTKSPTGKITTSTGSTKAALAIRAPSVTTVYPYPLGSAIFSNHNVESITNVPATSKSVKTSKTKDTTILEVLDNIRRISIKAPQTTNSNVDSTLVTSETSTASKKTSGSSHMASKTSIVPTRAKRQLNTPTQPVSDLERTPKEKLEKRQKQCVDGSRALGVALLFYADCVSKILFHHTIPYTGVPHDVLNVLANLDAGSVDALAQSLEANETLDDDEDLVGRLPTHNVFHGLEGDELEKRNKEAGSYTMPGICLKEFLTANKFYLKTIPHCAFLSTGREYTPPQPPTS